METTESTLVRRRGDNSPIWCDQCGMAVPMLSVEEASIVAGVSARSVNRWIEAGRVHSCEPRQGALRICLRSLSLLTATESA
jgi:hypothetical protein